MIVANGWEDYELIDAGDGERLERWGSFLLRRPDPQAIWPRCEREKRWNSADALYERSRSGGGEWKRRSGMPTSWTIRYREAVFRIELMGFKHTGIFPEQAGNWEWVDRLIRATASPVRVLNLFAYTGGATIAAALAGAEVCHVDSSKGMIDRARENLALSGIAGAPVRFIVDDVAKFVEREKRRGKKYEGVILDPPSFGRGPKGEVWKVEEQLFPLLESLADILSDQSVFVLVNSYTAGLAPTVVQNMVQLSIGKKHKGRCVSSEVGIPMSVRDGLIMACGMSVRWESLRACSLPGMPVDK